MKNFKNPVSNVYPVSNIYSDRMKGIDLKCSESILKLQTSLQIVMNDVQIPSVSKSAIRCSIESLIGSFIKIKSIRNPNDKSMLYNIVSKTSDYEAYSSGMIFLMLSV